ncbi:hypothetical protein ACFWMU_00660 [Streptomyces sp. NPDC058357]|uniref:hypothetical protein n=1 Tax=unclassified Streptomyces TaxID=2593676 RepID=UPI003660204E
MTTPFEQNTYVAHTGTDVYGPGKVIGVDGALRRVRFVHFVATINAGDLRDATPEETYVIEAWIKRKQERYGGEW